MNNSVISISLPVDGLMDEIKSVVRREISAALQGSNITQNNKKRYVHGVSNICRALDISPTQFWLYRKEGWIEPAIIQMGRKVKCDYNHAMQLMRDNKDNKDN
ncbi:MAG: DUF3853 family protein [Bacteroidales bacterium]|jgi:hypothetical protein|nr:DUF3853 family protein [Bacteroidales bacterium]